MKYWTHQEYCNPRESDVVEADSAVEWVFVSGLAVGVVLVPVDAVGRVPQSGLHRGVALLK